MIIRGTQFGYSMEQDPAFSPGVTKTQTSKTQSSVPGKLRPTWCIENADPPQNKSELYLHDYDNTALQKRQKHDTPRYHDTLGVSKTQTRYAT